MISWPKSLVTELAERRCTIFLGAGASAGAEPTKGTKQPPDWNTFLLALVKLVTSASDRTQAETLIANGQYLDAAEIIWNGTQPADRATHLRDVFVNPHYKASAIHKLVYELDAKIVITTNYDQIYENYCHQFASPQAYNVCKYYETHALNDIRSNVRCIFKAHGCVTDATKVILTRSSYFDARRQHQQFYAILDSLFLTNTVLFIGAGLSDPDIQLVLENANIAAPSVHPHYAVVPGGRHAALVAVILRTYNIHLLEYSASDHTEVVQGLEELRDEVLSMRTLPS
jgi:hypothetical protein